MFAFPFAPARSLRPIILIAALLLMAVGSTAVAMRVSPMVIEMEATGARATARLEVQNINPGTLAFETRVTRIEFGADGSVTEQPADQDFLVFPPQGTLATGARQVIRLQWVGGEVPASQAYYVAVRQLPVRLDPGSGETSSAQVQIVYNMKALVMVSPPNAKPDVETVSVKAIDYVPPVNEATGQAEGKPGPGVEVTLRNTGKRHAMATSATWVLKGRDLKGDALHVVITPTELNAILGTGYIAALDGQRTFRVPVSTAFGPGPISLQFRQR